MPNRTPSLHRRREEAWDQIFLKIVQVQGAEILNEIVKTKVQAAGAPRPSATPQQILEKVEKLRGEIQEEGGVKQIPRWLGRKALTATLSASEQTQRKWLSLRARFEKLRHHPPDRQSIEKLALEALTLSGFLGGVLFGLQLPQIDLRLNARGKGRDALILHAAALMASEIAIEWLQEILRRTLLAPTIRTGEARFLNAMSAVLSASLRGIERGWSARQVVALWIRFWRSPVTKQHQIATDARAIEIAHSVIERLRTR